MKLFGFSPAKNFKTERIGCFYIIKERMYSLDKPVQEGITLGKYIRYGNYYTLWCDILYEHPTLKSFDPGYFPRGMIFYDKKRRAFILLLNKAINQLKYRRLICGRYNLKVNQVIIEIDSDQDSEVLHV